MNLHVGVLEMTIQFDFSMDLLTVELTIFPRDVSNE